MTTIHSKSEQPLASRFAAELSNQAGGIAAWRELGKAVPPPQDLRLLFEALEGANQAYETACSFLVMPNSKADALCQDLDLLYSSATQALESANEEDAQNGLIRTLTSYPAWRLLVEACSPEIKGTAFQFVIGIELAVSIATGREMGRAFAIDVRRDKAILKIQPSLLLESVYDDNEALQTAWTTRFKKQLTAFRDLFEGGMPPPLPKKSRDERFEQQWTTKAAFATFAARTGVLDDRCLSRHQFLNAMKHPQGALSAQYKTAIFFLCMSGFSPALVHEIPISLGIDSPPICYLAFKAGRCILIRDFERLAHDQASPKGIEGEPASLVLSTPLPFDLSQYLSDRMQCIPHAKNLGDLVPLLTQIQSTDSIYPSLEELQPTWARLRPSAGRILVQMGFDSFLTALLTADFSISAKSKLYYATVKCNEWWAFVNAAYEALGFAHADPQSDESLAFGSRVTPTSEQLFAAFKVLHQETEFLRPKNRSRIHAVLEFHAAYTRLVCFEIMVLLALRESSQIPIPGRYETTIAYLVEKSSAGRRGGMAAVIPTIIEQQIFLYRSHCKALLSRIRNFAQTEFEEWLRSVADGEPNLYFSSRSIKGLARSVSTGYVLDHLKNFTRFASDFGRKYLENELRRRGINTEDTDRILRHDVAGQSATSGTSDGTESSWVRRMRPVLDSVAKDLGFTTVHGLGGNSK